LTYLKGLCTRGKKAVAFGSYGWGKGAVKAVEAELVDAGIEIMEPGLEIRYRPDDDGLASCRSLGERVANFVKEQMMKE